MKSLQLTDTEIIKSIVLVLNNDQTNTLRKRIYDTALRYVKAHAEKVLLEQELADMETKKKESAASLEFTEKNIKYELEEITNHIQYLTPEDEQ